MAINSSRNPEIVMKLSGNVSTSKAMDCAPIPNSFPFLGIIKANSCMDQAICFSITIELDIIKTHLLHILQKLIKNRK